MRGTRKDYDRFYGHYCPFVTSFVGRRVDASAVEDVVAEVFLIAWRRRDDVPDDALPWLYLTARNVIGNRYRSDERLARLREKLRRHSVEVSVDPAATVAQRDAVVAALTALGEIDRELILLAAWEGLTAREIGEVMNLSPGAVGVRLHRVRQRMVGAHRAGSGALSAELQSEETES